MGRRRSPLSLIIVLITNALTVREDHVLDVFSLSCLTYDSSPGFLNWTQDGVIEGQ